AALSAREWALLVAVGVAMGLHFVLFNTGFRMTSYESTVLLLVSQPLMAAALGFLLLGEKVTKGMAASVAVGAAGLALLVGQDWRFEPGHLPGDAVVLLCSLLMVLAYVFSRTLRQRLSFPLYATLVFGVAALASAAWLAAGGQSLARTEAGARGWAALGLLVLIPTLGGHALFGWAVKHVSAFHVNLVILAEPVIAVALKAALRSSFEEFRGSALTGWQAAGGAVLLAGIVLGFASARGGPAPGGKPRTRDLACAG
ncbi:MAG: DMT family transporter, partial [Planctomycetes bacterium]|nr:DMT family transporter [Planctomycetota bacterium]